MKSYTELEVWIESRKLVNEIYYLAKKFPNRENYGITSQITRSAVSIPSNIAKVVEEVALKKLFTFCI